MFNDQFIFITSLLLLLRFTLLKYDTVLSNVKLLNESGLPFAVYIIINGVQQLGSAILSGAESIGSDIVNTFSSIGVATWHGLVTFGLTVGNFFYGAFHDLSGAVYGAFTRIASAFEFIGKFISSGISAIGTGIHNLGNWIYNGIIDGLTSLSLFGLTLYQDIRNIFTTIYNGLVIAGEDIPSSKSR